MGWLRALVIAMVVFSGSALTGAARQALSHDYVLRWTTAPGLPVSQKPVIVAGVVYVASQDGMLRALDLQSGGDLWHAGTGSGFPLGPTIDGDTIFIANQSGPLHAYDLATGERRWVAENVASPGSGAPATGDGLVFINRFGPEGAELSALNAASGEIVWSAPLGQATFRSPAVVGGLVVVMGSTPDGSLPLVAAFDTRTGTPAWRSDPEARLVMAGAAGSLVLATGPAGFIALDASTGAPIWEFQLAPDAPGGVWSVDGPDVAGGVLFVSTDIAMGGNPNPSSSGMVYALDATDGELLWATEIEGGVAHGPAAADDVVALTAGLQRGLYVLDAASGDVAWYNPQRTNTATALTASDGWLIVADQDGSVAAWQDLMAQDG